MQRPYTAVKRTWSPLLSGMLKRYRTHLVAVIWSFGIFLWIGCAKTSLDPSKGLESQLRNVLVERGTIGKMRFPRQSAKFKRWPGCSREGHPPSWRGIPSIWQRWAPRSPGRGRSCPRWRSSPSARNGDRSSRSYRCKRSCKKVIITFSKSITVTYIEIRCRRINETILNCVR